MYITLYFIYLLLCYLLINYVYQTQVQTDACPDHTQDKSPGTDATYPSARDNMYPTFDLNKSVEFELLSHSHLPLQISSCPYKSDLILVTQRR